MHSEEYFITQEVADILNQGIKDGKRIVAVGTTSTRTLESAFDVETNSFKECHDNTEIFIYPGYKFKCIDSLITNFVDSILIMAENIVPRISTSLDGIIELVLGLADTLLPEILNIGVELIQKLITGITGQDGSYLAEFLLEKGYEVHGIMRRSSSFNTARIEHLYLDEWVRDMKRKRLINLHYGDMTDSSSLIRIIQEVQPTEIYNLAAQSHVKVSFDVPEYTAETDATGTLRLLEAVRILKMENRTRIYQASTSELYGKVQEVPQSETTPFYPRSPYAVAKLYGFWITKNYRESYGMYAVNGILFNHESPRRGENFVTRKITLAIANIMAGKQETLYLGNMNAKRDWGFAGDYVEGMWRILQQDKPGDYVLATNETHTVREFVELSFAEVGVEIEWQGEGVEEKGIDKKTGKVLVAVNPRYFRPAEVELLWGDATKAETELGWQRKVSFKELVAMMVDSDMRELAGISAKEFREKNA